MVTMYDPPSGWRYGFPKPYEPSNPLEPIAHTLRRDGYHGDADFAAKHCRFWDEPDTKSSAVSAALFAYDEAARRDVEGVTYESGWLGPGWTFPHGKLPPAGWPTNDNVRHVAGATGRRGDWMETWTGVAFYPLDARPDEIHIEDIAHALSMLCRYGGHGFQFYSVAEHSVHVYRWLVAGNYTPDVRLAGLLHDATEAYMVDLPRPLKRSFPEYKKAESNLWRVVAERFELVGLEDDLPVAVHDADNRILGDEIRQNMTPMAWHAKHDNPLGVTLEYWNPQRAEAEFLRAFREIERVRQQQRRVA